MNYALWIKAGAPEICAICVEEQRARQVPLHLRQEPPLPCEIHGDPRWLLPELRVVCQLYNIMRNYHEIRYTKENQPLYFLNLPILQGFCRELGLNFVETFERIEVLHQYLDGAGNA